MSEKKADFVITRHSQEVRNPELDMSANSRIIAEGAQVVGRDIILRHMSLESNA